jgi:tetratricopeptide (TPR) repeat protein
MAKGDYEEAIAVFQRILDNNQDYLLRDAIYMELGLCFEKTGSLDKAKESYQQVVVNFPDSPFLKDAEQNISILEENS